MSEIDLQEEKLRWEVIRLHAEVEKLESESSKIRRETAFYPFVVGSGATLAIVAIIKLFL